MPHDGDRFPFVELPAPVGRPMRLGPFPSAGSAAAFAAYAAAGAVVIPFAGVLAWLPCVAVAFALTAAGPMGVPLDRRIVRSVRRWARAYRGEEAGMTGAHRAARVQRACLDLASGRRVAIVRCGGQPLRDLPPEELRRRYDLYRELLAGLGGPAAIVATAVPIDPAPCLPPGTPAGDAPVDAYREMLTLLLRARGARRVYVALWSPDDRPASEEDLERRAASLVGRLSALGLVPQRLEGRALAGAARRFGWGEGIVGGGTP
ncbi:MAG: hypothetical protein QXG65_04690 [Thermoplasmata archaeon]